MQSHIDLTACKYNPGGDDLRFCSDNLLHDPDGVLNSPVNIRLVSFADHALDLLWTGISSSPSGTVSYPEEHGGVTLSHVQLIPKYGPAPKVHVANREDQPKTCLRLSTLLTAIRDLFASKFSNTHKAFSSRTPPRLWMRLDGSENGTVEDLAVFVLSFEDPEDQLGDCLRRWMGPSCPRRQPSCSGSLRSWHRESGAIAGSR